MNKEIEFVFKYLKKIRINIDEQEFLFQYRSHPDYPSLLAISDTLNFFNIKNGAVNIPKTEVNNMPDHFIVGLRTKDLGYFSFVERKRENYISSALNSEENNIYTEKELISLWDNYVLLIENDEESGLNSRQKNHKRTFLKYITSFSSILFLLIYFYSNLEYTIFTLFPVLGIIFSFISLKDLLGTNLSLITKICNTSSKLDCNAVINTKKWKIFKIIHPSDLSLVFFLTQMVTFLIFIFFHKEVYFIKLQFYLLLYSTPLILFSLLYQKLVVKKWCIICILIISILIMELSYIGYVFDIDLSFDYKYVHIFSIQFVLYYTIWLQIKKLIEKVNNLKTEKLTFNRFKRDSKIFRTLIAMDTTQTIPDLNLIRNYEYQKVQIVLITNPFCKYCEQSYNALKGIMKTYSGKIQLTIFFKSIYEKEEDVSKKLFQNLLFIYNNKDFDYFVLAMDFWYEKKDIELWLERFDQKILEPEEIDKLIMNQNKWCDSNNINFTPCVLIDGYQYPVKYYEIEDLIFLIEELFLHKQLLVESKNK